MPLRGLKTKTLPAPSSPAAFLHIPPASLCLNSHRRAVHRRRCSECERAPCLKHDQWQLDARDIDHRWDMDPCASGDCKPPNESVIWPTAQWSASSIQPNSTVVSSKVAITQTRSRYTSSIAEGVSEPDTPPTSSRETCSLRESHDKNFLLVSSGADSGDTSQPASMFGDSFLSAAYASVKKGEMVQINMSRVGGTEAPLD